MHNIPMAAVDNEGYKTNLSEYNSVHFHDQVTCINKNNSYRAYVHQYPIVKIRYTTINEQLSLYLSTDSPFL